MATTPLYLVFFVKFELSESALELPVSHTSRLSFSLELFMRDFSSVFAYTDRRLLYVIPVFTGAAL